MRTVYFILLNTVLVNIGFVASFAIRYGYPFPEQNFNSYKLTSAYISIIFIMALAVAGVFKSRFSSSWELFTRLFSAIFLATLLSVALVYVVRISFGAFPTSVFAIAFFVNLLLMFKLNQFVLRVQGRIRKKVIVIGEGSTDDIVIKKAQVERIDITHLDELAQRTDADELIICGRIPSERDLSFITLFAHKFNIDLFFSPACYFKLLADRINGNGSPAGISTFIGRKRDIEEFMMRWLDIAGSIILLIITAPAMLIGMLLIKLTSRGPAIYTQERVGKDGRTFTLYKLRTMVADAEKQLGPVLAVKNDPRVTPVGRFLRDTRLDEVPQLINVLNGDMSLVGPRPERPHFVRHHKFLMELRLAVRPGLTGLAQVRNAYDLHPRHKIKYDYLYIQRRSAVLNLYIMAITVPVMIFRRGQ